MLSPAHVCFFDMFVSLFLCIWLIASPILNAFFIIADILRVRNVFPVERKYCRISSVYNIDYIIILISKGKYLVPSKDFRYAIKSPNYLAGNPKPNRNPEELWCLSTCPNNYPQITDFFSPFGKSRTSKYSFYLTPGPWTHFLFLPVKLPRTGAIFSLIPQNRSHNPDRLFK